MVLMPSLALNSALAHLHLNSSYLSLASQGRALHIGQLRPQ